MSWTPLLKQFSLPDSFIGYFWSLINIAAIIGVVLYKFFLKEYKEKKILIIVAFLVLICGSMIFISNSFMIILIFLLIWNLLGDIDYTVFRTYFHKHIPTKLRATTGSIESMIMSLGGIIAMPLTGLLIDSIGTQSTIFISALLSIPIIFLYLRIKEKK
jgi:predicted MFS family arabinose efflux permease